MSNFRPLLAATADDDNFHLLKFPMLASPKLDGIRVLVRDDILVSRSLKPIRNVHLQAAEPWKLLNGLDGEIIVGDPTAKDCFRRTTSAVMSGDGGIKDWCYHIFDSFLMDGGFDKRLGELHRGIGPNARPLSVVQHRLVNNADELIAYEQQALSTGYEGVMLRSLNGRYKYGRSTFNEGTLLKLKRGQLRNGDATIIGFEERMSNTNEAVIDNLGLQKRNSQKAGMVGRGDLGAFLVKCLDTGLEFKIGTGVGLNDALRAKVWASQESYVGKVIRYEWFQYGGYDKPRFPQYVGFRDEIDIGDPE